ACLCCVRSAGPYNGSCACLRYPPASTRLAGPLPIRIRLQESSMRSSFRCTCILCGLLGLALAWLFAFGPAPAAHAQETKGAVSFINDVAPILKENCFACHDAKKKKGKLEMTSYETIRKGGS